MSIVGWPRHGNAMFCRINDNAQNATLITDIGHTLSPGHLSEYKTYAAEYSLTRSDCSR